MWSWSVEHLEFLMMRWAFKNPSDILHRHKFREIIDESVERRREAKINDKWLYFHKEHIRQMMTGAELNTAEPVRVSKVTDNSVIELRRRQIQTVG